VAKNPILLVGHAVHTTKSGAAVKELAEKMNCPVIQTSGGTSYIAGLEDRTFQYVFSDASIEAVEASDCVVALATELGEPVHFGRWRHWHAGEATRKWIYVQQDPTAIGVNRAIDVPLVGDVRAVVPQLTRALGQGREAGPDLAKFMKDGQAELDSLAAETLTKSDGTGDVPIHTSRFIVEISGGKARTVVDGLLRPQGLSAHGGNLFVVDAAAKSVSVIDPDNGVSRVIASNLPVGAPAGITPKFLGPIGDMAGPMISFADIAVAADGTIYIAGDAEGSVLTLRRA